MDGYTDRWTPKSYYLCVALQVCTALYHPFIHMVIYCSSRQRLTEEITDHNGCFQIVSK